MIASAVFTSRPFHLKLGLSDSIKAFGPNRADECLREHCEEYDDGTPLGTHDRLIKNILEAALRASGIVVQMPDVPPSMPRESVALDFGAILWLPIYVRPSE